MKFELEAYSFKKMEDPIKRAVETEDSTSKKKPKYIFYARANSIPTELKNWMKTNPRDQKTTTDVAKQIYNSLMDNEDFHNLNRGIVYSAEDVTYDNKTNIATLILENPDIHGNIDGGHTQTIIIDSNDAGTTLDERYVIFEVFTGIDTPADLAAARNTSVQVDLKSIEELKKNFETLKKVMYPINPLDFKDPMAFHTRIAYKMNENIGKDPIDVREIIAILNIFNQKLYPIKDNGHVGGTQPIQSYTGKEMSLKKFLSLGKDERNTILENMADIIPSIFALYEKIETEFPDKVNQAKKRYGSKKYSKHNRDSIVGQSNFLQTDLKYIVPKGIIYPVLSSFRALVAVDNITGKYTWKKDPSLVWEELGVKLATIVMEEKEDNPEYLGKSNNLWSNLFKEVIIHTYIS